MTLIQAFDVAMQSSPSRPKRGLTRAQRERIIGEALQHYTLDAILADLRARHPNFLLSRSFVRDLERMLTLKQLSDLGLSPGKTAAKLENL
jgi:uncharacterized protein YjiS (DUF1127 family)